MAIRIYQDSDGSLWDKYVLDKDDTSCYHLAGWKHIIERSFGHKTCYLLSEDENLQINGILPIVYLRSLFFGRYAVSLPYFNYGGVCADSEDVCAALMEAGADMARSEKMAHLELRHSRHVTTNLPVKTTKVVMRLPLPSTGEELMKEFPSKLRSQIKRPLQAGMYAEIAKEDGLDGFYEVFSRNMRDLGTPVYSKTFFRNILFEFPAMTWICTVYTKAGQPVASAFLVGFKDTMEIPWASSLRTYNRLSPNMLLYWSVLEFACREGFKVFDFGRSTLNEGTYRFKEQWGAKPVQLYWYYWLRNGGPLPEINPTNPKYGGAIKVWRRLPVSFTRLIGPHIVKNLP